jgi:hypothetical protein
LQEGLVDGAVDGDARVAQRHLDRCQRDVHARQHRDVGGSGTAVEMGAHGGHRGTDGVVAAGDDAQGAVAVDAARRRADDLRHPAPVAGEEVAGRADHRGRAAVVDLEPRRGRGGEGAGEVDEPLGRGARVAVDGLVVVADPEHRPRRSGHQPQQQEVGGREVLELVDQELPARVAGASAGLGVAQQELDGADDLLVEVDRALPGQGFPVARHDVDQAVDVARHLRLDLCR